MREFKFRVWNPDEQQLMYFQMHNVWFADRYLIQDKHSIQQYTGLKDWTGKEIYEGDILCLSFKNIDKLKEYYKESKNTLLSVITDKIKDNTFIGEVTFDGNENILSQFTYYVGGLISFAALKAIVSSNDIEVIRNNKTTE